jgi:putative transposase
MARPLRVLYPGAVYHVTARGNERQDIFRDDSDRHRFLSHLGLAVGRYGWLCHAFCIMGNHYHLLVETPRANLPTGMRHLNGCYSASFNRRWNRVGHLLQGRYRAELVEKQAYLLALIRYVALNPMRTSPPLCDAPEEYRWSSYPALLGLVPRQPWLTLDWILAQFADDYSNARSRLKAFVDEGLQERPLPVGHLYFATDAIITSLTEELEPIPEIPREHWQPLRPPLDEILTQLDDPIAVAYRSYGYTLREIAAHIGCHPATVSRRLRRAERCSR